MTYFDVVCIGVMVFLFLAVVALFVWRERYWSAYFLSLHEAYRNDVSALLDRVMARDFPEYVQAKAYSEAIQQPQQPMGIEEFSERIIGS